MKVIIVTFAQVSDVGAGHHATRGTVELLARPAASVRSAVGVQQALEPLRYVQPISPISARV